MAKGNLRNDMDWRSILMKETLLKIRNMDMGFTSGQQVIFTKAISKKMNEMDTEKCSGRMDLSIWENGRMGFNMALERCSILMEQSERDSLIIMYI